ncbi:asparagine synthase-related protein [Actinosynnema sp. NPDC047251]|uniref:asparagine synthase (glutamine-hydrolyzing) n=1 Tax=Saccharothrix espanaensis (strain ATCC 51144 / DSM 44229 / JCM 9112 / NBRC 15066 / NRRL 15764) TaxID=1179773 RepID=K0K7V1_SACES|nr:asparagine synthase-related protein [Saccharothrix espanaensis]CCH32728.1 putative asparagine synthase [Saccharothrix espanaensis DSM 44229]
MTSLSANPQAPTGTTPRAPGFLGSYPADRTLAAAGSASGVWPDLPALIAWGPWRSGEFRSARCPAGRVLVVGDCLADDTRLHTDLAAALRANRPELVTRWPGSYLAVVVTDRELVAFTDLAGQHPLYFHADDGGVVFGTSPLRTAEAAGIGTNPDPLVVAADIFCSSVPSLTVNRTALAGLHRLDAGEALRVSSTGSVTRWAYAPPTPDPTMSAEDCATGLREALDVAVAARMARGGSVSADFSGGLDSTSIAFLAARHRREPLPVFAYHHPDAPADDLSHALHNARLSRHLRLEVVRGTGDTLAYQNLAAAACDELPDFATTVRERNRLRLRHVAATGGRVHLGGEGADALVVAPPSYLGDLAGTGQVGRLLADTRSWAKLRNDSPGRVLTRAVRLSRTPMRGALLDLAQRLRRGDARHPDWVDAISWWPAPGLETGWLSSAARRMLADFVHAHAGRHPDTAGPGVADFTAWHDLRRSGAVQRQLGELARPFGVWPQAPFLDNDVIRACTALPAHRRASGTEFKPLLRTALRERVPADALRRRTKGNYLGEDYRGVRAAAPTIRAMLRDSRLADLGLIEPRSVLASVERTLAGAGTPFPAFNRLIAYDLWLGAVG